VKSDHSSTDVDLHTGSIDPDPTRPVSNLTSARIRHLLGGTWQLISEI